MKLFKIVLLFLIFSFSQNSIAVSNLYKIPQEDREKIEKLLSFLVWDETFAYVLFGSKPMSVSTQDKTLPDHYLEKYQYTGYELEKLWNTWEKYAHLFPMNEFIFLIENHEKWFSINLLNKSNCLKVIEKNLALFQKKTGCNLNVVEMFDYIVTNARNDIYKNSLNKSQTLYGILLGYGKENSLGFENYLYGNKDKRNLPHEVDTQDSTWPIVPSFASFSEDETNCLIAEYMTEREKILKIYSKGDFLEATINQLTIRK